METGKRRIAGLQYFSVHFSSLGCKPSCISEALCELRLKLTGNYAKRLPPILRKRGSYVSKNNERQ